MGIVTQIPIKELQALISKWVKDTEKESLLLKRITEMEKELNEDTLKKHAACTADRILTRQCYIIELQNLILMEQNGNVKGEVR
jgi:hypothetical protein